MNASEDPPGQARGLQNGDTPENPARDHTNELRQWAYDQMPIALGCYDVDNRLVAFNALAEANLARTEKEMRGRRLAEIFTEPAGAEVEQILAQVLRTGESLSIETFTQVQGESHSHAWSNLVYPLKDPSGRVRGVSMVAMDTTTQYLARQRLALVNGASSRIGTTLDTVRTAQELANVAVEGFADFVSIDLLMPELKNNISIEPIPKVGVVLRHVAHQSVLQGCPEALIEVGKCHGLEKESVMSRVLANSETTLFQIADPQMERWQASRPPIISRYIQGNPVHSLIMIPLLARGATLGLVQYVRHANPVPFDSDDLLLAEEITAKAGLCIDNALRYTHERDTALSLQRSLLPQRTPRQAALDIACRYLPAGARTGIGGDWFDVIPLSGARVALVVGDVVGHGIHASATMGRLRTAVRALADIDVPPDELLTHLDDVLLRLEREEGSSSTEALPGEEQQQSGEVGATCLYAVYDPVSRHCALARAGHPAPVIVQPDGTIRFPEIPAGPPLGIGGLPFESVELDLPEGSLITMFTDGLIEAGRCDTDVGVERLCRGLARSAAPVEEICDNVLAGLPPGPPDDDIALLIARTRGLDTSQVATWDLPSDPSVVAAARKMATAQLAKWKLDDTAFVTELVISELVTNAIRYGLPPIQLRLIHDATLICEVSDASSTAPHLRRARTFDEGGRGLLLVAQLTQRWGTRHTLRGKTIWAEQEVPPNGSPSR